MSEVEGFDLYPYRTSALLTWPVEFLDGYRADTVNDPHVSMLYFPDVREWDKEEFMGLCTNVAEYIRTYRVFDVDGAAGFGPDFQTPVLTLNDLSRNNRGILNKTYWSFKHYLESFDYKADNTYGFRPHITVDLRDALQPPETVLLRPVELWWMDDVAVKV